MDASPLLTEFLVKEDELLTVDGYSEKLIELTWIQSSVNRDNFSFAEI